MKKGFPLYNKAALVSGSAKAPCVPGGAEPSDRKYHEGRPPCRRSMIAETQVIEHQSSHRRDGAGAEAEKGTYRQYRPKTIGRDGFVMLPKVPENRR